MGVPSRSGIKEKTTSVNWKPAKIPWASIPRRRDRRGLCVLLPAPLSYHLNYPGPGCHHFLQRNIQRMYRSCQDKQRPTLPTAPPRSHSLPTARMPARGPIVRHTSAKSLPPASPTLGTAEPISSWQQPMRKGLPPPPAGETGSKDPRSHRGEAAEPGLKPRPFPCSGLFRPPVSAEVRPGPAPVPTLSSSSRKVSFSRCVA